MKTEKAPIPLENNYEKYYSESSFWDKIKSVAAKAARSSANPRAGIKSGTTSTGKIK